MLQMPFGLTQKTAECLVSNMPNWVKFAAKLRYSLIQEINIDETIVYKRMLFTRRLHDSGQIPVNVI